MRTATFLFALIVAAAPALAQEGKLAAEFREESKRVKEDCGAFNKLMDCAITLATDHPLHVAFGSIAPQNGLGFGVAFGTDYNPSENWRLRWSADAVAALGGAWRAGGGLKVVPTFVRLPKPVPAGTSTSSGGSSSYPVITIQGQIISLPRLNFYGLGPDSSRDAKTFFGSRQTIAGASVVWPIGSGPLGLSISGEMNGRGVVLFDPPVADQPPIDQLNTEASAPGLDDQPGVLQFSEGARIMPVFFNGRARLNYLAQYQQFVAPSNSAYSFRRWTIDLKNDFPIYRDSPPPSSNDGRDPNECEVNPATNRCNGVTRNRSGWVSVRALVSKSQVGDSSVVPFYFQQTLGGSDINGNRMLATYDDYRFRGPHLMLFQESVEHSLGSWPIGVWLAAEQGQVALQETGFENGEFRQSVSAGLTLRLGGFPLAVFSISGGGSEGRHIAFTISTSLLGGSSRPSLH